MGAHCVMSGARAGVCALARADNWGLITTCLVNNLMLVIIKIYYSVCALFDLKSLCLYAVYGAFNCDNLIITFSFP